MIKIYGNIEINSDYDYYEWLRVDKNATTEEIANAFKNRKVELASNSVNMSGEDVATSYLLLENAYTILADNELRHAYDTLVKEAKNEVNNEYLESIVNTDEIKIESNNKDKVITELESEKEILRKINEANEEYIKELERKLSISSNSNNNNNNSDKEDKDINKDLNDSDKNNEEHPTVKKEDNNNNKNEDIKPIFHDDEEKQKVVETEEIDKSSKIALKAARGSSKVFVSVAAVAAIAIVILTYSANSTKRAEDKKAEAGLESDSLTTSMVGTTNSDYDVEEEVQVVEEEPYEVQLDVNSDTVIYETVDKIENEISKLNDPVVKDMFNRTTIESLVRYTRDNTILSGETAYELFQVLYNNGIDTSMFFENLDSYQIMNTLFLSTKAIDQNNNSYDDENNAYNAINSAVDYLSPDDFAAIWNVSAITDQVTGYSSMIVASGCAEENGLEGPEYQNEINSVPSVVRENAKKVYNKVKPYDNSYIMKLRINALDNENVRTLG